MVCGGSLYGDVQKEKQSELKHINYATTTTYRHLVRIVPGTPLEEWYRRPIAQSEQLSPSGHSPARRRICKPWRMPKMAWSKPSTIRAIVLWSGLQFHPERMLEEYEGNWRVWQAFGAAVHQKPAGAPFRKRIVPNRRSV